MIRRVTTVHPFDPWGSKVGGIENFIRLYLQHTPKEIESYVVGVTEDPKRRPLNTWTSHSFESSTVHFCPIMEVDKPNKRTWFPLFLRFPLQLRNQHFGVEEALVLYHRVEPLASSPLTQQKNLLFLHSHPLEWIGAHSEVKWKYVPWAYRWVERQAFRKAKRIFCVNQSSVEYVKDRAPKTQCQFIPTMYDETKFHLPSTEQKNQLREYWSSKFSIPKDFVWIIFAGRLEHQKNPLLAVQTIAELKEQIPNIQLLMAGEGSLQHEIIQKINQWQITNHVRLLGSLASEQMAQLYQAGDVLLLSSRFEGMPLSVLEALACGLPVVSTPVGEIPNRIHPQHNGAIAREHLPISIAHALITVIQNLKHYLPEDCHQSVRFFQSNTAIQQLYQQLLEI